MNRIQSKPPSPFPTSHNPTQLHQARLTTPHDVQPAHTTFVPMHYERNYAYPLLVWLHGPDDDERQLQRVMPLVSMRNYVAIGPRGTIQSDLDPRGYCWRQTERDIALAEERVLACIESAEERYNISPSRIFVGGYECGGTMAFRVGMRNPELFAGIISIGGRFPTEHRPLANYFDAREVPMLIAQGLEAEKYTQEDLCRELKLFHTASFKVNVRQYPCGDELTTQMLHDIDVWMMERVTGVPAEV